MNDRAKRRTELYSGRERLRYRGAEGGRVERQRNRFTPAPCFEKPLRAMLAADRGA